jgi:hypothetical protein
LEVKQYFHDNGTTLEHYELIGQKDFQETKRAKAKQSADKRWQSKTPIKTDANALPTDMPTECTATATALKKESKDSKKANASTSTESVKPTGKKTTPRNTEDLKTRPDLNDTEYLKWLGVQGGYTSTLVNSTYRKMVDWCQRKNEIPSRLRLLKWLEKEGKQKPMTAQSMPMLPEIIGVNPNTGRPWI